MRKLSLLSLFLTASLACINTPDGDEPQQGGDELGFMFQALTPAGETISLPPVLVTSEMAERAKGPSLPEPPRAPGAPASGSIRHAMTSVKNQGSRGTCATFSSVGLVERYVGGDLSEQCIVREIGGNEGAWPVSRLELLTSRGAISETACKYHTSSATANIPAPYSYDALVRTSGTRAILDYRRWSEPSTAADAAQHVKESINQGHPVTANFIVVDGTRWFESGDTRIDRPATLKCGGVVLADGTECPGHSVIIVGYDDADSSFVIKNSWGTSWKDRGYGRLSYDYFKRLAYGSLDGLRRKSRPTQAIRGDFNGDRRDDVMIVTASGSFEYLGLPDGKLQPDADVRRDLPLGEVEYTPGDFNGDGKTDLVVTTRSGSYVYLGKAGSGFTPDVYVRGDLPLGQVRYTPGDFNGDGRTDLIMTTASGSYVYLGKADGTFIPDVYVRGDLPLGQVSFTPGDYNGDGRTDVMITTASGSFLYRGRADGKFDEDVYVRRDLSLGAVEYTPGDFNGDGKTDLVITTGLGSFEYLGRADGRFDADVWTRADLTIGQVEYAAADLSGDGKADLVITTALGSFVYTGASPGFVADRYVRSDLPLGQVSFFPSDFNGDGKSDLIITTALGSFVYLGKSDGSLSPDVYTRSDLPLFSVRYY